MRLPSGRRAVAAPDPEPDRVVGLKQRHRHNGRGAGGSLYELDSGLLAQLRPDLILTQEQCDVCAVNEATVRRVAAGLPGTPPVVESVNPTCLAEVHAMFRRVGDLLGAREAAERLIAEFAATASEVPGAARDGRPGACSCSNGSTHPSPPGTGTPS